MKLNKLDGLYSFSNGVSYFCISCKHQNKFINGIPTCNAYPQGIPIDIWRNDDTLINLCKGKNGFEFEEIKYTDEELANLPVLLENI